MPRIQRTLVRAATMGGLTAAAVAMTLSAASPASASPARAATTGVAASSLQCTTGSGGSFGSYYGWGSCTGTGTWKLRVSCTAGFTYDSPIVINIQDTQLIRYGSCTWGVSSATVIRLS